MAINARPINTGPINAFGGGGGDSITATGIASGEAFGNAAVGQQIATAAIASAEAFGAAAVGQQIATAAIESAEVFGSARLAQQLAPAAIGSAEAFGSAAVALAIGPAGIGSGEAFGDASVAQQLAASGIGSAETFGAATIQNLGTIELAPAPIASGERFGRAELTEEHVRWRDVGDPLVKPVGEKDELVFDYTPWLAGESIAAAHAEPAPGIREIVVRPPIVDGPKLRVPYEVVGRLPGRLPARILATVHSDNTLRKASRRAVAVKIV